MLANDSNHNPLRSSDPFISSSTANERDSFNHQLIFFFDNRNFPLAMISSALGKPEVSTFFENPNFLQNDVLI